MQTTVRWQGSQRTGGRQGQSSRLRGLAANSCSSARAGPAASVAWLARMTCGALVDGSSSSRCSTLTFL